MSAMIRCGSVTLLARAVSYGRIIGLFAVFVCLTFTTAAMAAPQKSAAAATFKTKCALCHGPDGSGNTTVGKSLMVPDLRSDDVQKLPDSDLITVVTEGKNGMPSFKSLGKDQIQALVAYVRTLAPKK